MLCLYHRMSLRFVKCRHFRSYCRSVDFSHSPQNWNKPPEMILGLPKPKSNHTRCIHTSCPKWLQLRDGQTFEEWKTDFYKDFNDRKKSISQQGINYHPLQTLGATREYFYVLVKEGSDFNIPEDWDSDAEIFSHPDVLATNHLSRRRTNYWMIYDRYNTAEEWEEKVQEYEKKSFSRNILLTSTMGFILLNQPQFTKIDQSMNAKDVLTSPLVKSYVDYILDVDKNIPHCQRALMIYMRRCKSKQQTDLLESVYGRAREKIQVFSFDFMKRCVTSNLFDGTKYWEDALKFIKLMRVIKDSYKLSQENEARILLQHNQLEAGFCLLGKMFQNPEKYFANKSVDGIINIIFNNFRYDEDPEIWKRNREIVETFLALLKNTSLFPRSGRAVQTIARWFHSIPDEKWEYALIHNDLIRNRKCPFTNIYLKEKLLTDEEYDYLRKVVMKSIVKPQSHQVELKSFFSTIFDNGPFDIVVDGLNLFYGLRTRMKNVPNPSELSHLTVAWLRNFVTRRQREIGKPLKVLVVSRQHMRADTRLYEEFASTWYASNYTEDDPYFLYAALLSGRNCRLLTLDHLKDVHYKITENFDYLTVNLIYKWQQIHQDLVLLRGSDRRQRQEFDVSIQRTANTWHIPFYSSNSSSISPAPTDWLCLKRMV